MVSSAMMESAIRKVISTELKPTSIYEDLGRERTILTPMYGLRNTILINCICGTFHKMKMSFKNVTCYSIVRIVVSNQLDSFRLFGYYNRSLIYMAPKVTNVPMEPTVVF